MSLVNKQYSIIQLRRGLNSEFASSNIVLASGEPAYATDLKILKVGDGVTPWNSLISLYASGAITAGQFSGTSGTIPVFTSSSSIGNSIVNQSAGYINVSSGILVSGSGQGNIDISMRPRYYNYVQPTPYGQAPTIKLTNTQYKSWGPGLYLEFTGDVSGSGDIDRDIETPRLGFKKTRGTLSSPQFLEGWEALSIIRTSAPSSGDPDQVVARISNYADGAIGAYPYQPSRTRIEVSSGPNVLDKYFQIGSYGNIETNCYVNIDNGLSAPTPVFYLGIGSGNVAVNYDVDRQFQTITLDGTAVNFTKGTGWNKANKSVDVLLHITATTTTTVSFDAGFITDWYVQPPTFTAGTYMVLIRSIGLIIIQGHYIGKKI